MSFPTRPHPCRWPHRTAALSASVASAERHARRASSNAKGRSAATATHADLVKAFGADNVVYTDVDGAEGEKIKASVLYPNDPKARLEFIWSDEQARRRSAGAGATDQSAWATRQRPSASRTAARGGREAERQAVQAVRLRLATYGGQGVGLARRHAGEAATRRLRHRGRVRSRRRCAGGQLDRSDRRQRVHVRQHRHARGRTLRGAW